MAEPMVKVDFAGLGLGPDMSMKLLVGIAAAAVMALPVASANAATYVSYLEYKNTAPNTAVAPFGSVTLTEIGGNSVDVLVKLFAPQIGFVNTGNQGRNDNKAPFTFNLTGDYDVTVFNPIVGQQFVDGGFGAFQNNNFGTYTNKIDCCGGAQGGGNYDPTDLHFVVKNLAGTLTFAGVGATFNNQGRLLTTGTGPRFLSTVADPTGFWFSADVVTNTGATFNIAARDTFQLTSVPESATWAMMIIGFGAAGSMLRRRHSSVA